MFMSMRTALADAFPSLFAPPPAAQMAALCHREGDNGTEVLLITSSHGRWILPKGWPIAGLNGGETALQEAWEEAGVRYGDVAETPVGQFHSVKRYAKSDDLDCRTTVYAIKVTKMTADFPEMEKRDRRWIPIVEAVDLVEEPGLRKILAAFAQRD